MFVHVVDSRAGHEAADRGVVCPRWSCPHSGVKRGRESKRPPRHARVVGVGTDDTKRHHDGPGQDGRARDGPQGDRRWRRRLRAPGETYGYDGGSEGVVLIDRSTGTDTSALLADGARLAINAGSVRWSLFDQLGSTVGLIDASRVLTDAYRFDPYGETVATYPTSSGTANPWRFRGLLDLSPSSAPLYEMNARDYSPGSGTFTSLDTVMGSAMDPLSMNRYLYAEANPTTLIDPSGHDACIGRECDNPTYDDGREGFDQCVDRCNESVTKRASSGGGDGGGGGGGDSGGSEAPTGTPTPIGPTELTSPLTSGPSLKWQIDQMSEADLRAYLAKWGGGIRAPSFTDLDYLYAWCRLGGLSSGTCLEYASLKDWGDLDGPTGTLAVAPAAAVAVGATPALVAWLASSMTAARDRIQDLVRAAPTAQLPIVQSAQEKLEQTAQRLGIPARELVDSVLARGTRYVDNLHDGNINVWLQRADSSGLIRVTLDPTAQRIISVGLNQARDVAAGLESGRFVLLK